VESGAEHRSLALGPRAEELIVDQAVADSYRCPYTGGRLRYREDGDVLVCDCGLDFPVVDGIARLIRPERETYSPEETREKEYYEATAKSYDEVLDWLFRSFREDEDRVRAAMIDLLELEPGDRVLESGAGTRRDTVGIAERLGPDAELFVQDLSPSMLSIGRDRMRARGALDGSHGRVEFLVGNAASLPFPYGSLDPAYHLGGFNLFSDRPASLAEMARVVCPGGKGVVGDEGMAPWHRESEYGAILMNSNKLYRYEPPLADLPETAREAGVRWLIGNAFYVIDFRVGEGLPDVDLDLPIQGRRGGTHRTRYFGALEGVTVEAKQMAEDAAARSGVSIHEWLDGAVRAAADPSPEQK
jgi:ubiquinone/menaquinone biosynthesis C-methylase UbiE